MQTAKSTLKLKVPVSIVTPILKKTSSSPRKTSTTNAKAC